MQIWNRVGKCWIPKFPDIRVCNHRQKRNGRKESKRLGNKIMRQRFKQNEDHIFCKSMRVAFGNYQMFPEYGGRFKERMFYLERYKTEVRYRTDDEFEYMFYYPWRRNKRKL